MTRPLLSALAALAVSLAPLAPVAGQVDDEVEAALEAGGVGEQADGYLGFPHAADAGIKARVDAINIKRRQGYTQVAQARNVPIEAFAASIGCRTLAKLRQGRAYSVGGAWATKGAAPITLPPQCGE